MSNDKGKWIHEGVFYAPSGSHVGCYYNNEDGWWYHFSGELPGSHQASSRRECIKALEERAARLPPAGERKP